MVAQSFNWLPRTGFPGSPTLPEITTGDYYGRLLLIFGLANLETKRRAQIATTRFIIMADVQRSKKRQSKNEGEGLSNPAEQGSPTKRPRSTKKEKRKSNVRSPAKSADKAPKEKRLDSIQS